MGKIKELKSEKKVMQLKGTILPKCCWYAPHEKTDSAPRLDTQDFYYTQRKGIWWRLKANQVQEGERLAWMNMDELSSGELGQVWQKQGQRLLSVVLSWVFPQQQDRTAGQVVQSYSAFTELVQLKRHDAIYSRNKPKLKADLCKCHFLLFWFDWWVHQSTCHM